MTKWTSELIPPAPRIAVDHMGNGPLVVFLHGIGGNRTLWHEQLVAFAPHFHAVAWDARGYGSSDDFEGPFDFGDISADLIRVLDHFKAEKAHIVGLSMGGIIAMEFCGRFPDRLQTLTICDSSEGLGAIPADQRRDFIRSRQEPLLAGKEPRDIAAEVARSLTSSSAPESVYERLVEGMAALHKGTYLKAIEAVANVKGLKLEEIRAPTHVVVGGLDRLAPPSVSRGLSERIPKAEFSIIPEAGHIANIEQPQAFNDIVSGFLLRHR